MNIGIYQIKNLINGKRYIGSAVDIKRRWRDHRKQLTARKHHSRKLQNAWNKYGADVFEFSVIEYVSDAECLIDREQHWIDIENAVSEGYNVAPRAFSLLGFKHSPESIEKCRAAKMGKKMKPSVAEALRKANVGRKLSDDHKLKIAKASTGRRRTPEQIAKVITAHLGVKRSAETRRRISDAAKGRKTFLGRSHSDESKKKISLAKLGNIPASRKLTPEQALEIRSLREDSGLTYAEIGKIYGVTGECVGNVVRGVTFRNAASELGVTFYDLHEV